MYNNLLKVHSYTTPEIFSPFGNIPGKLYVLQVFIVIHDFIGRVSGVRRKFPTEVPSFVTIVWRHKSTLGEVPKARPL